MGRVVVDPGMDPRLLGLEPGEAGRGDLDGRDLACREVAKELGCGGLVGHQ
jgi:hypothetical protein